MLADNDDYAVQIKVTDSLGATGQATTAAATANVPPTVTAAADQSVDQGTPLSLHVATFTDPGFTTTYLPAGPTESFTAEIDWGDGTAKASRVLWPARTE